MSMSREEWLTEMSDSLGVDPEDVLEVAAMFFGAIDARLTSMRAAYDAGDVKELGRLAHGLKGDAANMRFHESSGLARELEMQSREGTIRDFERQFDALRGAIQAQKRILGLPS